MNDNLLSQSLMNKSTKVESVKVVVRCRPMTEKEISNEYKQIVELDTEKGVVEIHPSNLNNQLNNLKSSVSNGRSTNNVGSNNTNEIIKQFTFDAVFDCNSNQSDIYDQIMRPIVDSVLEGFNGTIFAYGQTGTGKTYTMEGISNDKERRGIIPNSFSHIFNHIARTQNKQYLVRASYLEIYQEEIKDLLIKDQNKRLELKERADTGVYIKDLSSFVCKSVKEIEHVMYIGNQNRSVGSTNMNERSSRSHAIFIITIEHSDIINNSKNKSKKNETDDGSLNKNKSTNLNETFETISNTSIDENNESTDEIVIKENESIDNMNSSCNSELDNFSFKKTDLPISGHIRVGKLNLVDLAGSERQIKTGTVGQRQKEAIKINLSLSALGNVISSLVDSKSTHIPYRDSKLTRLLQDSLGGNSKTVMIANIGPASYNYEETLTTLRYASRAKNIKNKPHVNEDPKDALLRQFQLEIERLKMLLSQRKKSAISKNRSSSASSNDINNELKNLDLKNLSEKIKQMESKLLCGGRNIIDHTNEQQRELEKKAQLIALQKQKEREIRQKLEEQQENTYEIKETFTSLQQEVELKKRELKKLFLKIQSVKSEIKDTEEANSRERRGLEDYQNESMKELKFKYLVIENFIPVEEKNKLLSEIYYDKDSEEWKYINSNLISNTTKKQEQNKFNLNRDQFKQKPIEELNLNISMMSYNLINPNLKFLPITLRNQIDNNLILNLIEPIDTVKSYKMPTLSPTIKAAIDSALDLDNEILINASPNSLKPNWLKNSIKTIKNEKQTKK